MNIEEMKQRKKELGYSNNRLSELSGVPVTTIQKIFSGETTSPRYNTIQALSKILSGYSDEVHEDSGAYRYEKALQEDVPYNKKYRAEYLNRGGEKTIDDYDKLPEGTRVELIDGVFYDMAAPTTVHQSIAFEIGVKLKEFVSKNGGKCVTFLAPTDVQLESDNKTMVQPDVLVVCDRDKITKERIIGAPDFIVEVVSPGNAIMDVLLKLRKYKNAGVREYWIVYPDEKMVTVYDFISGVSPEIYTFEDKIPVAIWGGKCKIDFSFIYSQIDFMY
ncbi:MAG: Uma2 family endonuclease [Eubacterium sp.]|nr:Uma2 family endonuclease [Eubacterium sp.]